jgi:hypothetical protein
MALRAGLERQQPPDIDGGMNVPGIADGCFLPPVGSERALPDFRQVRWRVCRQIPGDA